MPKEIFHSYAVFAVEHVHRMGFAFRYAKASPFTFELEPVDTHGEVFFNLAWRGGGVRVVRHMYSTAAKVQGRAGQKISAACTPRVQTVR